MSVLIKGMEMPSSCSKCDLRVIAIGLDFQCAISGETVDDYYSSRHPKCPIVKVPTPHGRLIDAYEIEKCVHEWYDVGEYVFADTIRNADTIIEAEVSE